MPPVVALHLATAVPAVALGGALLFRRKGNAAHRILDRAYVILLLIAAVSSFWIQSWGHFSLIHLLSVWTLFILGVAIWQIRRGNVAGHRRAMSGMYLGLLIAGGMALMPGRVLGNWVAAAWAGMT